MKTPQEMAEEFSNWFVGERRKTIAKKSWYTGFEEGLKAAKDSASIDTNSIDTGTKMQWISVKDRLPEYDHFVLLWHPDFKRQFVGCRVDSGIIDPLYWWQLELDMHEPDRIITHWMPLPEAPKEEK